MLVRSVLGIVVVGMPRVAEKVGWVALGAGVLV